MSTLRDFCGETTEAPFAVKSIAALVPPAPSTASPFASWA